MLKRSYSIAGFHAPHRHRGDESCAEAHEGHLGHGGWIELTIKAQPGGLFSQYAQTIVPGDSISVAGPFGKHFVWNPTLADPAEHLVLIAGGTGIAPFKFFLTQAIRHHYSGRITLLFSVKTGSDIIYRDELAQWTKQLPGLRSFIFLTRPSQDDHHVWKGLFGRIDENAIRNGVGGDVLTSRFYVCGPTPFVTSVIDSLRRLAVSADRIATEKFGGVE
jgi:ferredoxin-NADP reductase